MFSAFAAFAAVAISLAVSYAATKIEGLPDEHEDLATDHTLAMKPCADTPAA